MKSFLLFRYSVLQWCVADVDVLCSVVAYVPSVHPILLSNSSAWHQRFYCVVGFSCWAVSQTMRTCQPDILMLELCESRTALLQLKEEEMSLDDVASPSFEILMRCVRQVCTIV